MPYLRHFIEYADASVLSRQADFALYPIHAPAVIHQLFAHCRKIGKVIKQEINPAIDRKKSRIAKFLAALRRS